MGSITTNGAGELLQFNDASQLPVDLDIDGHVFTGDGSGLINLPGSNITPGSVSIVALDASGSPSSTTFLRGDDTWATAVTSVGLSVAPVLGTVSGSPVTGNGTLAIAAPIMSAGTFIAAPSSGSGSAIARSILGSDIEGVLSDAMDLAFGSSQGSILQRDTTGWGILTPGSAGQVLQTNGVSANASWAGRAGGALVQVPVRQTVLSGVANASGQANFITTGSGLQPGVNTTAGSTPLTLAFAAGFGSFGSVDYVEQIVSDQSTYWGSLTANVFSYLAITRTGVGAISPYVTLAPPQYDYAYNQSAQASLSLNNISTDDFGNSWTNTSVTFSNVSPAISGTYFGSFNGSSSRMAGTGFISLGNGGWSLRGWIKSTSFAADNGLFGLNNVSGYGANIFINTSGKLVVGLSSNGSSWDIANITGTTALSVSTWYFVELTYDPIAGKYFTYINGVADAGLTIVSTSKIGAVMVANFGAVNFGGTNKFLSGNGQGFEFLPYCQHPNGITYSVPTSLSLITASGYASDWFDLTTMTMKSILGASISPGTNPTFTQVNRLYVGEATTGTSAVSAVVSYAFQGQYDSGYITPLPGPGTAMSKTHHIGVSQLIPIFKVKCLTSIQGYSVGDVVCDFFTETATQYNTQSKWYNAVALGLTVGSGPSVWDVINKSNGALNSLPADSFAYAFSAKRSW
ncbi:Concanavalin A-like lectin/glucanases superfamily protein [Verrucomicrobium sp. GAS474]|uniref:LamG-like jellyroll fold domain-containing protein n=1 Tax=Verrucomicrobium sp. GAS474 TaxID=1882831 RepID=UPI00087C7667|nr:LamG-like jellyroll fold domain-containing protein [Verrucomicrobium sp. GAS474]SDU15705.1 Concanavalin A-like lectin/glucanases superfamily protein [Verrucomicrobium sp. GAS474]